jgi:hypothetical protein
MAQGFNLADTNVQALAKRKYGPIIENCYNGKVPHLGRVKKTYGNLGLQIERPAPFGMIGGASLGVKGPANRASVGTLTMTTKSAYVTVEIDRRTKYQFKDDGAWVDAQKEVMRKCSEKFNWLMQFQLTGNGDGALGTVQSVTDNGGGEYAVIITAATWIKACWELSEYVNFGNTTDQFEITTIVSSTRTITVSRVSGGTVPLAGDVVYINNGRGNAMYGLRQVLSATTGTLYGATVQERFQAYQLDAASAPISPDLLTQLIFYTTEQTGVSPDSIWMSTFNLVRLLSSVEDQKRYSLQPTSLEPRAKNLIGKISFSGIEFMGPAGAIPVMVDRFIPDTMVWAENTDQIEIAHSNQGWADDDGTTFLRNANDGYEAYIAGYADVMIVPTFQGYAHTLSTT